MELHTLGRGMTETKCHFLYPTVVQAYHPTDVNTPPQLITLFQLWPYEEVVMYSLRLRSGEPYFVLPEAECGPTLCLFTLQGRSVCLSLICIGIRLVLVNANFILWVRVQYYFIVLAAFSHLAIRRSLGWYLHLFDPFLSLRALSLLPGTSSHSSVFPTWVLGSAKSLRSLVPASGQWY